MILSGFRTITSGTNPEPDDPLSLMNAHILFDRETILVIKKAMSESIVVTKGT